MSTITEVRNATLQDLVPLLQKQHADKVDVVLPATDIRSERGVLQVKGISVFNPETAIRPTEIMDGQIAERLGIPVRYIRKLRLERPDLYDANVNGWLHGSGFALTPDDPDVYPADGRRFLLRSFLGDDGEGIGRALLSDQFGVIDNLDVLFSGLEGIRESGVECHLIRGDISERRMSLRFAAPDLAALAPKLLADYRPQVKGLNGTTQRTLANLSRHYSPEHLGWDASKGEMPPVGFAGFDLDNSETGGGAFTITPVIILDACKNGLKISALQVRRVHLGSRLEEGVIAWSEDTRRKSAELVKAQTRDSVATFLTEDFLREQMSIINEKSDTPVENAVETLEVVGKKLAYSEEQQAGILAHFIKGGQMTSGGVLNAVTSYAQTVASPDEAYALESNALEVLDLVTA